jgi:conjugative relaxase-like TrwC/TraI family protein
MWRSTLSQGAAVDNGDTPVPHESIVHLRPTLLLLGVAIARFDFSQLGYVRLAPVIADRLLERLRGASTARDSACVVDRQVDGRAVRYYERQVAQGGDDYYSGRGESPGRWTGSGAETIGLGGRVDDDGFMALMEGRDPGTGERLKSVGGRSKVAAFDLTFSAPKSVSVLFATGEPELARALVEAHEQAVDAALGYLEREACRVRRGRGGVRREVGEGFVAAAYRHRMSRAEDPQLRTHVVAANMTRGADGRWTALDATPIYQHAKAAGFLYQAHIRAAVRERLPWVRWGPVRNGMAEIEQLAPQVLREFSTRRRQIEERKRELMAAGVQVGDSGREAIAEATRSRKRYGIDTAPWRDVVRARAAEHGLGARELDALLHGPSRAPEAPDEGRVSCELAGAGGLTERHNTFAKREAVMAWAAAHGQGAPAHMVEREAAAFLTLPDVHRTAGLAERRFTTSDLLAHEQAIVQGAQARRGEGTGRLDSALVEAVLASTAHAPSAEQARVIRGLTSSGHGWRRSKRWPERARRSLRACWPRPTRPAAMRPRGRADRPRGAGAH